jgi:serine/threonine protein phosphatase PrpC
MCSPLPPLTPALLAREWDRYIAKRFSIERAASVLKETHTILRHANSGAVDPKTCACYETIRTQIELDVPNQRPLPRTYVSDFGILKPALIAGGLFACRYLLGSSYLRTLLSWGCFAASALALRNFWHQGPLEFPSYTPFKEVEDRETRIRSILHTDLSLKKQSSLAAQQLESEYDNPGYTVHELIHKQTHKIIGHRHDGTIGLIRYGLALSIGNNQNMEDGYFIAYGFLDTPKADIPFSIFCILDGHGVDMSAFFSKHFTAILGGLLKKCEDISENDVWNALKGTFVALNKKYKDSGECPEGGASVAMALIIGDVLWVANVGNARVFLNANGKAIGCTVDANCGTYDAPSPFTRSIINRKGVIQADYGQGFINGTHSTARAMGDFTIQGVSARPKITRMLRAELAGQTDIIITSHGVFEKGLCSTRQVVAKVNSLRHMNHLSNIAAQVIGASYEAGSRENISAIIVRLP